jgi:hypothetical protein
MTIEFVSNDFSKREVKSRLLTSLKNTKILRGAVAFWTIDYKYFGDALINALKHEDSFYCVDVSIPTNFDALLKIHKKIGSTPKFYVHTQKTVDPKEHLLHSKIIIMERNDGKTEVWVGSHNFTDRALRGSNIESSLVITLETHECNEKFLVDALKYLDDIKNLSNNKPLDESSYFYFMALQTSDYLTWIIKYFQFILENITAESIEYCRTIEIEGDDLDNLTGSTIIIIGEKQKELTEMKKYGESVIIHAHDYRGLEFFYRADLRAKDKIDTKSSKQVEFGTRRVGTKKNNRLRVVLGTERIVKEQDLVQGGFYVNIEIKEREFSDKTVLVYSNPNFKDLWFPENIKKGEGENLSKILVAMDFNRFEEAFLPKLIYKISKLKLEQKTNYENDIEALFFEDEYTAKADNLKYISVFERRIYIIQNLINKLKGN